MKKIFCILFSVLIVMTTLLPLSVSADNTVLVRNIDKTEVEDDLLSLYPNLSERFPVDENDNNIYLIYFAEYGYTYDHGVASSSYNLYLYIYNPSRKSLLSDLNKIQFATKWSRAKNGQITAAEYEKFDLKLLKQSGLGTGTIFKYKVVFDKADFVYVQNGSRRYDISGIELQHNAGDVNDYDIGTSYTFTGYGKGLSNESRDKSTLACLCDQFTTISVDVHQVSYLTGNSSLDVGYSNQINSVYFSLPKEIEKKYGGLYSIKYEYNHYYTSPIIVTDNKESYNTLMSTIGQFVDKSNWPYHIYNGESFSDTYYYCYFNYGYEEGSTPFYRNEYELSPDFLTTLFLNTNYEREWEFGDVLVEASELEAYFKQYNSSYYTGKVLGYSADLFDLDKSKGYVVETKNINDVFSLEGFLHDENIFNYFSKWLNYGFGNNDDYKDIENIKYIEDISGNDLTLDFEKNLLVDDIYKSDMLSFYNDAMCNDENVYLLRYAYSPDYYSLVCKGSNIEGQFLMAQGNVYLNFDIIQFSFRDKLGNETIIPCVSDPTTGSFNVTDTDPDRTIIDLIEDIKDGKGAEDPEWQKFVFMVVSLIIVIVLIAAFVLACIYIPGFGASMLSLLLQLKDVALVYLRNFGTSIKSGMDNLAERSKQRIAEAKKKHEENKKKNNKQNRKYEKKKIKNNRYRNKRYKNNRYRYRNRYKKRYKR